MAYYLLSGAQSDRSYINLKSMVSIGANVGDYLEFSGFGLEGNNTDSYRLVGKKSDYNDLFAIRPSNTLLRLTGSSSDNIYYETNHTQPAWGDDFVVRLVREENNRWAVYINGELLESKYATDTLEFNQLLNFNSDPTDAFHGGMYYLEVSTDGGESVTHYWDANVNGIGNTLYDLVGGNDGTLYDFPSDDSQWVYYYKEDIGNTQKYALKFEEGHGGVTTNLMPSSTSTIRLYADVLSTSYDYQSLWHGQGAGHIELSRYTPGSINCFIMSNNGWVTVRTDTGYKINERFTVEFIFDGTNVELKINDESIGVERVSLPMDRLYHYVFGAHSENKDNKFLGTFYYGEVSIDGTTYSYDPSASYGVGKYLPELNYGVHGELIDFPSDNSHWILQTLIKTTKLVKKLVSSSTSFIVKNIIKRN